MHHLPTDAFHSSLALSSAKKQLRKVIRKQRQNLSFSEQYHSAKQLLRKLNTCYWYQTSRSVALYLANDGEINCSDTIKQLQRQGKKVYLPVLHPINLRQLIFIQFDQHTPIRYNRFGIQEPALKQSRIKRPEQLDLIIMPLVGYDLNGNRLGMGGGFYDTTFEKVVNHAWRRSPKRVGVAHTCQQVSQLPKEPWDIPLNTIVTPQHVISVSRATPNKKV